MASFERLAGVSALFRAARYFSATDTFWLKSAITLAAIAAATLIAIWFSERLGIPRVGMIYLIGVVAVSYRCGARYGLLAAVLATISYDFFIGSPHLSLDLGAKQNFFNIVIFMAAALLTGAYTERMREEHAAVRAVTNAASQSGAQRSTSGLAWGAAPRIAQFRGTLAELARAALAIAICAIAVGFGIVLERNVGTQIVPALLLSSVVIVAAALGSRPGLVAGIFSAFAFDYVFVGAAYQLDLTSPLDLLNFILFASVGWSLGYWADRLRRQQNVIRILLSAERGIFVAANEEQIRQTLETAIHNLLETEQAWVIAAGQSPGTLPGAPAFPNGFAEKLKALGPGQTSLTGPWRARALGNETDRFGHMVWLAHSAGTRLAGYRDRGVALLGDLATVAISQSRMNAQRVEDSLAARSDMLRRALLSSVSHDFRTPLAGILSSVTALIEQGGQHSDAQRHAFLDNIKAQAMRLNRYVENLLGIVRVDSGSLQVQRSRVLVEPLIYDAWDALSDAGGDRRILHVRMEPDAAASADPNLLSQVLLNLLENAIKFSPDDTRIEVQSRTANGMQRIEIADEGAGVASSDLPHIFERFYRGQKTTAAGTGLGLFIAKSLIESMDGRIYAGARSDERPGLLVTLDLQPPEPLP